MIARTPLLLLAGILFAAPAFCDDDTPADTQDASASAPEAAPENAPPPSDAAPADAPPPADEVVRGGGGSGRGGGTAAARTPANPAPINGCHTPLSALKIGAKYRCAPTYACPGNAPGETTPFLAAEWWQSGVDEKHSAYTSQSWTASCERRPDFAYSESNWVPLEGVRVTSDGVVPDTDASGFSVTDGNCYTWKMLGPGYGFRAGVRLTAWDSAYCAYEPR
ncbi:MAG: hypothetical protein ACHQ51_10150 [Elusimicrobiota bacterium]